MAEGGHKSKDRVGSGKLLIVGLGNPGPKYDQTRHNVGFMGVDAFAWRHRIDLSRSKFNAIYGTGVLPGDQQVVCLKPQTYMNLSGQSVTRALGFFDLDVESMIVLHDDIDLDFGTLRLKRGGGHGGHNGLRDIIPQLGGPGFARLRIGVGHPGTKEQVIGYVLARAGAEQRALIDAAIERAVERVDDMITKGLDRVMNELHRQPAAS